MLLEEQLGQFMCILVDSLYPERDIIFVYFLYVFIFLFQLIFLFFLARETDSLDAALLDKAGKW